MIQNHMLQMLAYVAMETPTSFRADSIRNEKVKVLDAIHPLEPEDVLTHATRGQYSGGTIDGNIVLGYREEPEVADNSRTETFAALRFYIDNWRWEGVPVYLRSGKRMPVRRTEIATQFKRAPEVLFRHTPMGRLQANELRLHIQPDQGIEWPSKPRSPARRCAYKPCAWILNIRTHFRPPAARDTKPCSTIAWSRIRRFSRARI